MKIWILFFCCLLFLISCTNLNIPYRGNISSSRGCSSYESEMHCLYWQSSTAFYNRNISDMGYSTDLLKKQIELIYEITTKKDKNRISEAIQLIDDVKRIATPYQNVSDLLHDSRGAGLPAWRTCNDTYVFIIQRSAKMMLNIGGMYKDLGELEKSKETYRDVIKIYIGNAYKSQIKEAEFALEDLKDGK